MLKYYKSFNIIKIFLLLVIIVLHGVLRIGEIPYAQPVIGEYFWIPSINFAAGKGFTDNQAVLQESPELGNFVNNFFNHSLFGKREGPKTYLSLFDTVSTFKDYNLDKTYLYFSDSNGYRLIIGTIWKYFGFNWYFVGIVNYLFSLAALLSLMYCSYRTLGFSYSFAIGFIYSISLVEINFVANFSRDGLPLWFASYLICALVLLFSKQLTLQRIVQYSLLIGVIIFGAIEGRSSSIYFLAITIIIYFLIFYLFLKEGILFKYSYGFKNSFLNKTFLFVFATVLTCCSTFLLQSLTKYTAPVTSLPYGGFMHVTFLGLGMWSPPSLFDSSYFHPSQVRYSDEFVFYLAEEYGKRVLGDSNIGFPPYAYSVAYGVSLKNLYFSIVKTYPSFFMTSVFLGSIFNTLFFLGHPLRFDVGIVKSTIGKDFSEYTRLMFSSCILFIFSLMGGILLYFKLKEKKICIILLSFVFFNAFISFLQFNPRHSLMAHPAYYFLSGIPLGFIYENFIKKLFYTGVGYIRWGRAKILLQGSKNFSKINLQKNGSYHHIKSSDFIVATVVIVVLTGLVYQSTGVVEKIKSVYNPIYNRLNNKLLSIEANNIKNTQVFFDSLGKEPLNIDLAQKNVFLPSSFLGKTIGIYCNIGPVTLQKPINIEFHNNLYSLYKTTITPVLGNDVIVFIPFFSSVRRPLMNFTIDDDHQCKSYEWSDLKDWKGPLWEGSYDKDALK